MNASTQTIAANTPEAINRAGFRPTLLRALDYLAGWATAELLMAILEDETVLSALEQGTSAEELARRLGSPDSPSTGATGSELTGALLQALHSEGAVVREAGTYRLAEDLSELRAVHGWMELLMEGYRELFQGVGRLMREGDGSIERNHLRVATGSARIAVYDAVPLTLRLIERLGASEGVVLDYGCGNALYLITLCAQHPGLRGARRGARAGDRARPPASTCASGGPAGPHHDRARLGARLRAERGGGLRRLGVRAARDRRPARRRGDGRVPALVRPRFPKARLLIVEVSNPYEEGRGELVGSDRQGRGYYNYYIWLHSVTTQRLLPHAQWLELFAQAGYRVTHEERVDDIVDSTGLEIGYALERV